MSSLTSITALDNSNLSRHLFDDGSYIDMQVVPTIEPTAEDIAADARAWRDSELQATDWVVPLSDHPQRAAYLTYRTALRNWPSTSDFPATKPTL
jgi:hypothetical protein|tara:strand:- start:7 stop:291 length:285 start_codon:yes stop_codon:yes gene_type:complete